MERTQVEIVLPDSKARVVLFSNLTNGQFRELQRMILHKTVVKLSDGEDAVKSMMDSGVSGDLFIEQQDYLVRSLINEIYDDGGTKIDNVEAFIYELSIKDGQELYNKVSELTTDSTLDKETKKK